MALFKKTLISGCEARGDYNEPYLTRYTLFECKYFQICLHVFHRSDADEHHDHPWDFTSIILWRGYIEETPHPTMEYCTAIGIDTRIRQIKYPLQILRRKAEHRHRVILIDEKPAVTLVFMGKRKREWGFYTLTGWKWWRKYFIDNKC